ncbi:MAG: sulfite exporter TauE/SafE family protein, partial [Actinobacteria bacterium]|nr:sulfite exporter TauE/SafE family protein [Actinomycetota bacterium]
MLGLVLGTLRLPLIVLVTGNPLTAAGTNIAISAAAAGACGLTHVRAGRVDWNVVAWTAPPSVGGAIIGALLADDVSETLVYGLIAAVLVWSGIDLAWRPIAARPRERLRVAHGARLAFLIGVLGGAVGVILGTLRMPALV